MNDAAALKIVTTRPNSEGKRVELRIFDQSSDI